METKILGISGKKQSGKNTSANFILGHFMKNVNLINDFHITTEGQLWIQDILGDESIKGAFDIFRKNPEMDKFKENELNHFIQLYSLADLLKENICINVLGLKREQCYGTDEQKNSETHLRWEDMPGVITDFNSQAYSNWEKEEVKEKPGLYYKTASGLLSHKGAPTLLAQCPVNKVIFHAPGPMTGRDVMQFVGTEIFRRMYGNIWADATIRKIKQDNPTMAIVCDVRFPNEVEAIQKAGGKVLRLLRDVYEGQDQHSSETALDDYPLEKFDWVLDNKELTAAEQNDAVFQLLKEINWIPKPFAEYIDV